MQTLMHESKVVIDDISNLLFFTKDLHLHSWDIYV